MSTLVINAGSSSLRFALFEGKKELKRGHIDRIKNYEEGMKHVLKILATSGEKSKIDKVGHRVVHGGEKFKKPLKINFLNLWQLEKFSTLAPLHNPANIACIKAARKVLPKASHYAVFDTAFHSTLPEKAFLYGLPYKLYKKEGIRRYGFHGSSHSYIAREAAKLLKKKSAKIISCHMGNGVSVAAIANGKCLDTSMGFTPLEGPMMGTRSGSIDPAIIFHLSKKMPISQIEKILEHESGFKGLSQISSDIRNLWAKPKSAGTLRVFETFSYQMAKIILSYFAALNGTPDAIVFTAGIGENAYYLREKICKYLVPLGLKLDQNLNQNASEENLKASQTISSKNSKIKVFVIKCNEEKEIAESIQ